MYPLDQSIENSKTKYLKSNINNIILMYSLIERHGYTHIGWSDYKEWDQPDRKDYKKGYNFKQMNERVKLGQQQLDILFGKIYFSFVKEKSNNPGFWIIDPEQIPSIVKNGKTSKKPIHSCSIPFWERPENTIRWKVSDAKESFVYIARIYNGNTLVKTFFGPEAVENAQDFVETQNSLYYSLTASDFNIQQEVFRYDSINGGNINGWTEFDTRERAEHFAKNNGYKLPVYKSF